MTHNPTLKEYDLNNSSIWGDLKLTILHNDTPVLHSKTKCRWKTRQTTILSPDRTTVLAGCTAKGLCSSKAMNLFLGDPELADKSNDLVALTREDKCGSKYTFSHAGRDYSWTRTHDEQFGGHARGSRDFVLVDEAAGEVLAAWSNSYGWNKRKPEARVLFFREMEWELELMGLAAVLGVEDWIRQENIAFMVAITS